MKRAIYVLFFWGACLTLLPVSGKAYLLSSNYVFKRMVQNYHSLQGIAVTQRVEAFGEDTVLPFASVDEKAEMHPFVPMRIWIGEKVITPQSDLPAELGANRFLIDAQRRYGFYKDVFLSHEVNLLKALLKRLGVNPCQERLKLLYPNIAYQVGNDLTGDSPEGIWIDKDRFIPLRMVGVLTGKQDGKFFKEEVDIRYGDYRLLQEKIWFPFDVKFFVNGKLSLRIKAFSATLTMY